MTHLGSTLTYQINKTPVESVFSFNPLRAHTPLYKSWPIWEENLHHIQPLLSPICFIEDTIWSAISFWGVFFKYPTEMNRKCTIPEFTTVNNCMSNLKMREAMLSLNVILVWLIYLNSFSLLLNWHTLIGFNKCTEKIEWNRKTNWDPEKLHFLDIKCFSVKKNKKVFKFQSAPILSEPLTNWYS